MTKRPSLSGFSSQKVAPAPAQPAPMPAADEPAEKKDNRKGMTLRLDPAAWRQLKQVALDEGRPAHDLLVDALNDYFRKKGLSPLA